MTTFPVSGILLDIEGTTSSISFVYDVMFPYARRELEAYLENAFHGRGRAPTWRIFISPTAPVRMRGFDRQR